MGSPERDRSRFSSLGCGLGGGSRQLGDPEPTGPAWVPPTFLEPGEEQLICGKAPREHSLVWPSAAETHCSGAVLRPWPSRDRGDDAPFPGERERGARQPGLRLGRARFWVQGTPGAWGLCTPPESESHGVGTCGAASQSRC